MRVHLQSGSYVHLWRLVPAFPLVITATQGKARVRRRGFERVMVPGHRVVAAPFEMIDLYLEGGTAQPAGCSLEIQFQPGCVSEPPLRHHLSQRVFVQPQHTWTAAFIADLLHASPTQVRRTLFSEGAALTELCRTQRLMRALFEVLNDGISAEELRRRIGWPPGSDLEAALYDWFGLSLHVLRRLATGRAPGSVVTGDAVAFLSQGPEQQLGDEAASVSDPCSALATQATKKSGVYPH